MNIINEGNSAKLPDFLIVGAAKSGTTSLYFYLKEHPQIFMPENKEPWFFSFMDNPTQFKSPDSLGGMVSNLQDYTNLFEDANNNQIIGEASPSYLYTYETTINNIKKVYGEQYKDVKIIILLRNPVDRAFSQYQHFKKSMREPLSFRQAIKPETIRKRLNDNWSFFYDYIGVGMYYKQVKSYLENFENVKVILFDEFKNDTSRVVKDLLLFLEADASLLPQNIGKKYNVSRVLRKDFLTPLYRFLFFSNNKVKRTLANLLPVKTKDKLIDTVQKLLLKRKKLEKREKKEIMKIFDEDFKKLKELINSNT